MGDAGREALAGGGGLGGRGGGRDHDLRLEGRVGVEDHALLLFGAAAVGDAGLARSVRVGGVAGVASEAKS